MTSSSGSSAIQEIVAVLGCPAAGDPTQYVFERAVQESGLDWRFVTFDVPLERAEDAIRGIKALGCRGCVLTGPLRQAALAQVDSASPSATFAGAVSMIDRQAGALVGHMTDGRAALEVIRTHFDPANASVFLLGAGPSAAAIALELALAGSRELLLANRSQERSNAFAERLAGVGNGIAIRTVPIERGKPLSIPEDVGLVVSAIPVADRLPNAPVLVVEGLRPDMVVADFGIGTGASPMLEQAAKAGACLIDGIEIRCMRTAIDFKHWTGLEADTDLLREALEEFLSA